MASRSSGNRGNSGAHVPGEKEKTSIRLRKNVLGGAASVVILGSLFLNAEPCKSKDYELSFISVEKKPALSAGELRYNESSRTAKREAFSIETGEKSLRPEHIKTYYDSLLLDFRAEDQTVAITDCGYCNCTSCICPGVSKNCNACAIADCTTVCNVCACAACACPCYCVCDCDCSAYACYCTCTCGGCKGVCSCTPCSCQCACACPACPSMCGYGDCSKM
jgi:hypothetical protein